MRTIETIISNKTYTLKPSALTLYEYRQVFNKSFLEEVMQISLNLASYLENEEKETDIEKINKLKGNLADTVERALPIVYILIEKTERPKTYEKFLESIESISISDKWLIDTIEICTGNFLTPLS